MADKKFYLNGEEVEVEISPILAQTLDETIDNITISLALNTRAEPYPPIATEVELVQVYDNDTTETINKFVVSADNVELVTQNPLRYKHTLTLVQKAQFLTKKEIRNTVFSTSLETSMFSIRSSHSYYLTNPTCQFFQTGGGIYPDDLALRSLNTTVYTELSTGVSGKIDLSKKKVNKIKLKKTLMAQIVKRDDYSIPISSSSSLPSGHTQWAQIGVIFNVSEPNDLNELLAHQYESDRIEPSITINVYDTNNSLIDTETISIGFDNYNNNVEQDIPEEICEWLRTFNDGTAEFVYNILIDTTYSTWDNPILEKNKMPFFYTSYIDLIVTSIESSCYDVIDTLLKQQLKETANYNRTTDPTHYVPLFEMPSADHNEELYHLLKNTSAPNFVFTQGNFYEALVEIFKMFDAIFTLDEDGYLDIEYYNEHEKTTFADNQKAGRQSSLGEERFANRLISYYQNTKINDRFPNSNQENATAYLRSKSIGVPGESDYVFMVPKPIDIVNQAFLGGVGFSVELNDEISDGYYTVVYRNGNPIDIYLTGSFKKGTLYNLIDITRYVNEESVWSNLNESTSIPINNDYSIVGKRNSFVYQRGTPYIMVSEYYQNTTDIRQRVLDNVIECSLKTIFGLAQNYTNSVIKIKVSNDISWYNLKLYVSYIALCDGKVVNESIDYKYDGGILINQNNGSIDINKLGLNMVGLSLKLGQPTLTMTQKICKWEDRVQKGQYIEIDGERWVANTCNYTLINKDLIEATIEFVKNFNGLASRIELNREKRLSNISNELTVKCEENYGEYIYYTATKPNQYAQIAEKICFNISSLFNQISLGFGLQLPLVFDERVDRTDQVNEISIYDLVNINNYTDQELEMIAGYVESNDGNGNVTINDYSDFSGDSVVIPFFGTSVECVYWDVINGCFAINDNVPPYDGAIGTFVGNLAVLKIGNQIIGAGPPATIPLQPKYYFYDAMPSNSYVVEYASLTAYDENDNIITEDEYTVENIAIPMVVYGSGNSVCYEMSFESPIAAGTQLLKNYTSAYNVTGYFSKYVLYTTKSGEATKFTIDFVMLQNELTRQFPRFYKDDGHGIPTTPLDTFSFGKIDRLAYYKKPNEIFALNYQLHFLPYNGTNNDYLANEYIKNNGFANGLNKKKLHIMYSTNENFKFDIFDVKATTDDGLIWADITSASANQNVHVIFGMSRLQLNFDFNNSATIRPNIKAWAICDEDDNIYFSTNTAPSVADPDETGLNIYFFPRHHRKEE